MRVLVCGGRDWRSSGEVHAALADLKAEHGRRLIVIHGGCRGADSIAKEWCYDNQVHAAEVEPIWYVNGELQRRAGPERNEAMLLLQPELVLALPGGSGTAHMVSQARAARITIQELAR